MWIDEQNTSNLHAMCTDYRTFLENRCNLDHDEHLRSGTRIFNDDHPLVTLMKKVLDCQYTQEENVTPCLSYVAGVGLQDLANQANQTEECN